MYVRWRKETQDWKGVIVVVLLQWGRLTENSTHGVSSNVRARGEGKTRLKGSNPSYPASTLCGVESDISF